MSDPVSLRKFFEEVFLPECLSGAASTTSTYRTTLRRLEEHLGRTALITDLNRVTIEAFLEKDAGQVSDEKGGFSSREKRKRQLHCLLKLWRHAKSKYDFLDDAWAKPTALFPQGGHSLTKFFDERFAPNNTSQKLSSFRSTLRHLARSLERDPVMDDLTPELIENYDLNWRWCLRQIALYAIEEKMLDQSPAAFGLFEEGGEHCLLRFVKKEFPGEKRILEVVRMLGKFLRDNPTLKHLNKQIFSGCMEWYGGRGLPGTVRTRRSQLMQVWRRAAEKHEFVPDPPGDGRRRQRFQANGLRSLSGVFERLCRPALLGRDLRGVRHALDAFNVFLGRAASVDDLNEATYEAFISSYQGTGRSQSTVRNASETLLSIWFCLSCIGMVAEPVLEVSNKPDLADGMNADSLGQFFHRVYRPEELANVGPATIDQAWSAIHRWREYLGQVPMLDHLTRETFVGFREYLENGDRSERSVVLICGVILRIWEFAARTSRPRAEWTGNSPETYVSEFPNPRWSRPPRTPLEPLDVKEMENLFEACRIANGADCWEALLRLLLDTGMPLKDAVEVTSLNLEERRVSTGARNGRQQVFILQKATAEAVGRVSADEEGRLFPFSRRFASHRIRTLLRQAGLPDNRWGIFKRIKRSGPNYVEFTGGNMAQVTASASASAPLREEGNDSRSGSGNRKAPSGGRPRRWEELFEFIQEQDALTPKPDDTQITKAYREKYETEINLGELPNPTPNTVKNVRYEYGNRVGRRTR